MFEAHAFQVHVFPIAQRGLATVYFEGQERGLKGGPTDFVEVTVGEGDTVEPHVREPDF